MPGGIARHQETESETSRASRRSTPHRPKLAAFGLPLLAERNLGSLSPLCLLVEHYGIHSRFLRLRSLLFESALLHLQLRMREDSRLFRYPHSAHACLLESFGHVVSCGEGLH